MLTNTEFTAFYHKYVGMVRHRAGTIVRNPQLVEDIVQESFLRFLNYEKANQVEKPAALLFCIATRVSFNRLRKKSDVVSMDDVLTAAMPETVSSDERVFLAKVLATCGEDEAQLVIMYFMDNMSHLEIAQVLGVSRRTVGNRLQEFCDRAQRLEMSRPGRVQKRLEIHAVGAGVDK